MGEEVEDQTGDVDMNNSEMVFDNLTILKEFGNIANLVKLEEFLDTVPKAKLRRVKWVPMFNFLKQGMVNEMAQELSHMWKYENMLQKLQILEKQKEKFSDQDAEKTLWRPQLGNVNAQLKANDVANLQKQKILLESLAKEYEARVKKLKRELTAKRGYLKVLQMDIQKYQKKNEEFISKTNEKIENHGNLTNTVTPTKINVDEENWRETSLKIDE